MAESPNGLASLSEARQRARRTMPPPRHPAPRHLTSADTQTSDTQSDEQGDPDTSGGPPAPATASRPTTRVNRAPDPVEAPVAEGSPAAPPAVEPPVKMTFYVGQDIDRYLEDVRIQGLTSRPKVDVSRSAVVRLALRRLREEMTPEQVKTLLAAQPTDPTKPGRKRR